MLSLTQSPTAARELNDVEDPRLRKVLQVQDDGAVFSVSPLVRALWSGLGLERHALSLSDPLGIAAVMLKQGCALTLAQRAWLSQSDPGLEQDQPLLLSHGLHALCLIHPELRDVIELGSPEGRALLVQWWMRSGRMAPEQACCVADTSYLEPSPWLAQDQPLPLSRGLHALLLTRADLRGTIDPGTPLGRASLVQWWIRSGRLEPGLPPCVADSVYVDPSPWLEQDQPLPLTRGLHAVWLARDDLRVAMDLDTPQGRVSLVRWWMQAGRLDPSLPRCIAEACYLEPSPWLVQDQPLPLTRWLHALWLSRPDLNSMDAGTAEGRAALLAWHRDYGAREAAAAQPAEASSALVCPADDEQDMPGSEPGAGMLDDGLNIIGYGRGEFGIGEDVRMAALALGVAGYPICVPRLPLKIGARQLDMTLAELETEGPRYSRNLICMPHYETLRLLGATRGAILGGRYNIGFWQWELARFPEALHCAIDVVDEIWSFSEFTAGSMRAVTDKPIRRMPVVVSLRPFTRKWGRADFGLPEGEFTFLTVVDGHSSLARKNPEAVIRAFQLAFPHEPGVRLVVKAMNVSGDVPAWRGVLDAAARDQRISVFSETMPHERLMGLQRVSDCFVSLHRSEGFGRNIAEAMLLGKPVIVSAYSGNMDFTDDETAFLVDGELIPVEEGQYAFHEGQVWFDADAGAAAQSMRRCVDEPATRERVAAAGRDRILRSYSPGVVASAYQHRLHAMRGAS